MKTNVIVCFPSQLRLCVIWLLLFLLLLSGDRCFPAARPLVRRRKKYCRQTSVYICKSFPDLGVFLRGFPGGFSDKPQWNNRRTIFINISAFAFMPCSNLVLRSLSLLENLDTTLGREVKSPQENEHSWLSRRFCLCSLPLLGEKGVSMAHDQALFALPPFVRLSLAVNLHH